MTVAEEAGHVPHAEAMTTTSHMTTSQLQLGQHVPMPASPEEAKLERVPNPQAGTNYLARFTCPEFTSLCPITAESVSKTRLFTDAFRSQCRSS